MANAKENQLGGFVALNTGAIQDSYSQVSVKRKGERAGFCCVNQGTIERCYSGGRVGGSKERAGFCAKQEGSVRGSFWIHGDGANPEVYTDWDSSVAKKDLETAYFDRLGWTGGDTWSLAEGKNPRLFDVQAEPPSGAQVIEIHNRRELTDMAAAVNRGTAPTNVVYRLMADIDLGGRSWAPIGTDWDNAFHGTFDGAGHEIRNFRIKAAKHPYAGFFGCVDRDGEVCNLTVDCVIMGAGNWAAPLCGVNRGKLSNCVARAHTAPSVRGAGLAAKNDGTIRRCAAVGGIAPPLMPVAWFVSALILAFLFAGGTAGILLARQPVASAVEVFAPVIIDPNAVPIDPSEDELPVTTDSGSDTSVSFVMNAEMLVGTENYAGSLGLRCPSWSTRGFVATLTLGDEVLYQSGLIKPGYGVDVITLSTLSDGSKLAPGEYECSVLLEFYDLETNEKAAVNTVVPLELTVQ